MTRVVVQRGSGPAISSQCRPPSAPPSGSPLAPPSAPASSSSTPPLPYTQPLPSSSSSSQVPLPSVSHSHPSVFFSSGDEGQDQVAKEEQRFNDVVELQTLVPDTITEALASSSLSDARGSYGEVNSEGHVESTRALEAHGGEDLPAKLKEPELVSHVQHDPELERLQEAPDGPHSGVRDDAARTAEVAKVTVDGERVDDSLENLSVCSEDLPVPVIAASTGQRKQEDGGTSTLSIPQGHYSSGQNVMQSSLPALTSSTFVPLSVPIPYPPPPVQSVTHALPLPPSGQSSPSPSAGAHQFPRSHEENDSGRPMGNANVSEAIGCSYLSALTPSVPFIPSSSSRRTRGGVTFRWIPRALKGSRNSPNSSRPTSPRTYGEGDGYNSADEQGPWGSGPSGYEDNGERERQFENELRRVKNLEVRRMAEDGNCLFRAVADQIYGDAEMYSETRQMCIDYMEKERDHFSQFVTESFTAYCKRKRRDKVYGNNLEIQAMAEMYNRPIHIYSYSTEPINIFHGSYETDLPPIRLSYHRSNHYNSLLDPCNPAVGAGLGFGSLRGRNVDTEQVKAALKAQQEQQIDKALIAEGRFYSDMELTEQEIERMVMEASRAEFLAGESLRLHLPWQEETSTSAGAEPSSSGMTGSPRSTSVAQCGSQQAIGHSVSPPATSTGGAEETVSSNVRMLLSMGFSYLQVMEAHSIFGDNVNNMLCYLLETETSGSGDGKNISRRKGKAAE